MTRDCESRACWLVAFFFVSSVEHQEQWLTIKRNIYSNFPSADSCRQLTATMPCQSIVPSVRQEILPNSIGVQNKLQTGSGFYVYK